MKRFFLFFVVAIFFSVGIGAAEVLVFTDSANPVRNTGGARVVLLDQVTLLEQELSTGLPRNIDDAERVVTDRLQTAEGIRLTEDLTKAYKDVMTAWQMGVSKIPAVVVDRQYVVYGQPDVGMAVATITQRRNQGDASRGYEIPSDTRPALTTKPMPLPARME